MQQRKFPLKLVAGPLLGREEKIQMSDFVNVNSIFEALRSLLTHQEAQSNFLDNGKFKKDPDVVIGVFGEEPYAEMLGDLKDVSFVPTDPKFLPLLRQ